MPPTPRHVCLSQQLEKITYLIVASYRRLIENAHTSKMNFANAGDMLQNRHIRH